MSNYIILLKKNNFKKINEFIKNSNMTNTLKNKRTSVWENNDLQISIDKSIIRILIFSKTDIQYYTDILLQVEIMNKIAKEKIIDFLEKLFKKANLSYKYIELNDNDINFFVNPK